MSTKTKTKQYEDATLLLNKGSLERIMKRRANRERLHRKAVEATVMLAAPLLFAWGTSVFSPNFRDAVNENTKLEIAFGIYALITVMVFMLAVLSEPWFSNEEAKKRLMDKISKLLKERVSDKDFNSELVRLAPMMQGFSKQVLKENPTLGKRLMQNALTENDAGKVAELMQKYFLAHQKDAQQFANVLTVAGVPQKVIDWFYATCVRDTLSFSMAQKLGTSNVK